MSLAEYLAKNYLTADGPLKKSKKRKRKDSGLIVEDDADRSFQIQNGAAQMNEDSPAVVEDDKVVVKSEPRWKPVAVKQEDMDDERPVVANIDENDQPRMESGARIGLQTAAQIREEAERRRENELANMKKISGVQPETVYRDATGRRVDVALRKAELRFQLEQEEKAKKKEEELRQGLVQQREKEARRKALEDEKHRAFANREDDVEYNEELKSRNRWNDPAAEYLSDKAKKKGKKGDGVPQYQGAAPPNRFGIRPGYRWDGVDRSNGFEKTYFKRKNERKAQVDEFNRYSYEE